MIFLTEYEADGVTWVGPDIEAKCWDDAEFILWHMRLQGQVPKATKIIGHSPRRLHYGCTYLRYVTRQD